MLNLYDYLTPLDNKRIENYIKSWGSEDYIGNKKYLRFWDKDKRKLFRLLGGKLIHSVPISIEKNDDIIEKEIRDLIRNSDLCNLMNELFYEEIDNYRDMSRDNTKLCDWGQIFNFPPLLINNKLQKTYNIENYDRETGEVTFLKLPAGMKTLRAMKKLIDFKFSKNPHLPEVYEEFRLEHSRILNDRKLVGELCFSIHPLDFLTISDNNNNWSSCMSWQDYGCYHTGTVEMMNSNNVICVYLKSADGVDSFNFSSRTDKDGKEYHWNSKKWRQLFYCTKEIIVGGKAYPYYNEELTLKALEVLRELAKNNWNHEYQYGIERYRDMLHINTYFKMQRNHEWIATNNTKKHNIIFETNAMYNDMFNDKRTKFWCIRNKVNKNKMINISGKVCCVECGNEAVVEKIDYDYAEDYQYDNEDFCEDDRYDYNNRFAGVKRVYCPDCYTRRNCNYCEDERRIFKTVKVKIPYRSRFIAPSDNGYLPTRKICRKCFTERMSVCPSCSRMFSRNSAEYLMNEEKIYGIYEDVNIAELNYKKDFNKSILEGTISKDDKVILINECPDCLYKYKNNSDLTEIIEVTFYTDEEAKAKDPVYWEDTRYYPRTKKVKVLKKRLKREEGAKYLPESLPLFTDDDFDKLYKGLLTQDELVNSRKNQI